MLVTLNVAIAWTPIIIITFYIIIIISVVIAGDGKGSMQVFYENGHMWS